MKNKYRLETMQSIESLLRNVSVLLCMAFLSQKMKMLWTSMSRMFLESIIVGELWPETAVVGDVPSVVLGVCCMVVCEKDLGIS